MGQFTLRGTSGADNGGRQNRGLLLILAQKKHRAGDDQHPDQHRDHGQCCPLTTTGQFRLQAWFIFIGALGENSATLPLLGDKNSKNGVQSVNSK